MPIACMACGGRVHETAVKCPHCGARTGAEPTKPTAAEALVIAQLEERRFYNELEIASTPMLMSPVHVTSGFAALEVVAEVVAAPVPQQAEMPRAIARERPRPPTVEPLASTAPEPAPPPSDQPRFLK